MLLIRMVTTKHPEGKKLRGFSFYLLLPQITLDPVIGYRTNSGVIDHASKLLAASGPVSTRFVTLSGRIKRL